MPRPVCTGEARLAVHNAFSERPRPTSPRKLIRDILPECRNVTDRSHRRIAYASALIVATAIASFAKHTPPLPLESFYVVTQATFHKASKWVDHILEVRPQGDAILVREIRIAPLDPACPHHVTVRAVERVLPDTTIKKLTGKIPALLLRRRCSRRNDQHRKTPQRRRHR